jgi:hypothetical protein
MAAYPLLFEADFVFFSARFSFRDLEAAVLALFFFGDLSAIGHPSLGSTDGFGTETLLRQRFECSPNSGGCVAVVTAGPSRNRITIFTNSSHTTS